MKYKCLKLIAPLALSLGVSGCNGLTMPSSMPAVPSLQNTTVDEKALFVAESAFSGGSSTLEAAVDSGMLRGANARIARGYYTQAYDALLLARQARAAGNSANLLEASIKVQTLVTKIFGLVGK